MPFIFRVCFTNLFCCDKFIKGTWECKKINGLLLIRVYTSYDGFIYFMHLKLILSLEFNTRIISLSDVYEPFNVKWVLPLLHFYICFMLFFRSCLCVLFSKVTTQRGMPLQVYFHFSFSPR